ncbi:hypothetical protein [Streptomyces sp. MH60]|uniref:hypothetical protein n=1 Tax=Streptomyces sp. MH60 TaxID=1940758 RepID=UPI000CEE8370|nr:hypothetical protein [Streptomyces sp. MH60]PPS86419.1 hypothetical protein BZZ08_03386 [Streptomyces sp. MH60]
MPRNDSYAQGVQYPILGDAPDIEEAFKPVVDGIVPKTVMRFANANARSAALTGATKPVPGMITYLIAEDRWDRRDGDNVWRPLSPGPWKPFTFVSSYSASSGGPAYRIVNNTVELRGTFQKTSGGLFITNDETKFATLPTEARPTGGWRYFTVATNLHQVTATTYHSARLSVGTDGSMNFACQLNSKTQWISLDGVRFSID